MAKGSPVIPIRIPPLFLAMIDKALKDANKVRKEEPYNRSSFILHAVREKLEHMARSRRRSKKHKQASKAGDVAEQF